jgi:hypothetical protein
MQENPSDRNSRAVPRAIASAVSDWRRSGGGTRFIWRVGDSIAGRAYPIPEADQKAACAGPAANLNACGRDGAAFYAAFGRQFPLGEPKKIGIVLT